MATLYNIVGEFVELYSLLGDPEVDEQTVRDTLEAVKGDLEVKAEGYVKVIRQLEAEQKAFEAEAEFFKQKATVRKNNIKRMKEALCQALIDTGHDDKVGLAAGDFTLKVQNNGGAQPLKVTGNVPMNMTKVITEPDNEKIRQFILDGNECEFAHLEERGKHLVIK